MAFFRRLGALRNQAAVLIAFAAAASAQDLHDQSSPQDPVQRELERLRARVEALERDGSKPADKTPGDAIDLSGAELPSIVPSHAEGISARPWYENVDLSGYGAFGYYDSGGTGTVHDGAFLVKEASLFIDAPVWKNVSLFFEIWVTHYLFDSGGAFDIGELYVKFSDLFGTGDGAHLGLKLGRIDIPFGEDYLRQDASDDPLISLSAADVWAIEEGAAAYGRAGALHWVLAIANGNIDIGGDDGPSKLLCAKLYGDAHRDLYLSASVLESGRTRASTVWLGRGLITPVGLFAPSAGGTSPNDEVESTLWEVDAHIGAARRGSLRLQFGEAMIDDRASAFDRNLLWFSAEPAMRLSDKLSLILRYSQVATDDADEGYSFQGDVFGSGDALGYDMHRMERLACGILWTINPHAKLKLELGHDWIDLIAASPFDAENDERLYGAVEVVASF
ncbi:MAG TPA: hypothetical protein VK843_15350 [Planctomycetota bacterium]|nr:hypothetical protein [Planctomycetota bacterium]